MKSRFYCSRSELKRIAKQEIKKQEAEVCPTCMKNVVYQTLATAFWVLHRDWGYGAGRLKRLKDDIESEFNLMENGIPGLGKSDYSANQLIEALKEFGIDFDESQYEGSDLK